jgi:hypothetical protein
MKKALTLVIAAAAVTGLTALAAAQAPEGEKGAVRPQGTQQPQGAQPSKAAPAPGGAMMRQQGAQQDEKTLRPQGTPSAQEQGPKTQEHMGQGPEEQNKATPQRGAQEEQRGLQQQRGAQEQKSGGTANERNANQGPAGRGASVQLSQDQRRKIQGIIGHDRAARVSGNVNFDVTVGATVPRSVHVEVLPEDVVEIVPQYEGFDYVLVGDEILIIDPESLEIVAIIPA